MAQMAHAVRSMAGCWGHTIFGLGSETNGNSGWKTVLSARFLREHSDLFRQRRHRDANLDLCNLQ